MLNINDLKSKVRTLIETEQILRYLDIVVANPGLSYLNHMLLFFQSEKAELICGRGAWESMGRTIKENAVMLHMIYPAIVVTAERLPCEKDGKIVSDDMEMNTHFMIQNTKFDIRYLVIGVYALSDTQGNEILKKVCCSNFMDRIAISTGASFEITDKKFGFGQMGEYDATTDIFYISKFCPNERRNEVLLSIFIDYMMHDNENNDKELKLALRYVVLKYFDCDTTNINPKLFGLLRKRTDEELTVFFRQLQILSWKAINELQEVLTLNFNETAFINELIYSDRKDDLYLLLDKVIASIENEVSSGLNSDIKEELLELKHKLSLCDEETIQKMYIQKQRNRIFTYPATLIRH